MYRACIARSLAAIFTTLSLLSIGFVPIVANAYPSGNVCAYVNKQCTAEAVSAAGKGFAVCGPCIVQGFSIPGQCLHHDDCKEFGDATQISTGAKIPVEKLSLSVLEDLHSEGFLNSLIPSASTLKSMAPFLVLGAGMSLLTSLMSPSGGSNPSSGSNAYSNGVCTTQYYYTSNTNALFDPCAIYNPSGGSTTGTGGTTDNVSGLLGGLNPSNSPGITLPSSTAGSISPYSPLATIVTPSPSTSEPSITIATPDTGTTNTPVPVSDLLNNTQYYSNTTGTSTPSASQTPLNQNPVPVPTNGLHGDILSFGGGATIYASSRSGNTEISGFYGSTAGGTSQSAAGRMCQSRPWANNFLSYVIPPTFFDNLCSWGGYQVGVVQTTGYGGGGGASTGSRSNNVSVPPPKSTTVYGTPTPAQAKIWARPASVSLGGRTTIFWTSQNVTSCTESSSDGNFSGQSTSGGASTVALSGATTFSIQCNTIDGKTISDSTTVQIGI